MPGEWRGVTTASVEGAKALACRESVAFCEQSGARSQGSSLDDYFVLPAPPPARIWNTKSWNSKRLSVYDRLSMPIAISGTT